MRLLPGTLFLLLGLSAVAVAAPKATTKPAVKPPAPAAVDQKVHGKRAKPQPAPPAPAPLVFSKKP